MVRMKTDDIDKFFEYGISIPTRTIYMGSMSPVGDDNESGVDFAMAEYTVKGLHVLDNHNNANGDKPIMILMNNVGGDVYHGQAIYDAIKACKSYVTIKTIGHAMSMGSIILQAADHRVMSPNSTMMIHYGYWGFDGTPKAFEKWAEESKRIHGWMENVYLDRLRERDEKFCAKKLRDWLSADTFFTSQQAVELGLADEVV